ncbi:MAG: hypothetical protein HZB91_12360 [Elusimicrobia bacterium]|nr:hypothetical protein [Elusimicrobiota bacterium]
MRHPLFKLSPAILLGAMACATPGTLPPSDTGAVSFPVLPVRARVETADASGFCASEHLLRSLNWSVFNWVERSTSTVWPREVRVACSNPKPLVYALEVLTWPAGSSVARIEQRFTEDSDAEYNVRARIFGHKLARTKKVTVASLEAYFDNQSEVAELGAAAWKDGRWEEAAKELFMSLESDIAPAGRSALYRGLSEAYAGLGKPIQAFWCLRAFEVEGGNLENAKWDYFKGKAAEKRYHESALKYKDLIAESPWSGDSYADLLSKVYRRIGWKLLAGHWKERAKFIRKMTHDRKGSERLLERLR